MLSTMNDADFALAIRRIRRQHWLHYPVQGLLMSSVLLLGSTRAAGGNTPEPTMATWPVLLGLLLLLPVLGLLLYAVFRQMQPNLRRPAALNLRVYQSRLFLRNSLLSLLGLPLLISFVFTRQPHELALCAAILMALSWQLAPSAATYQHWLLGRG